MKVPASIIGLAVALGGCASARHPKVAYAEGDPWAPSGGGSLHDAAPAVAGQSLMGTLPPGEARTYRISLAAGEAFAAGVYTQLAGDGVSADASLSLLDPNGVVVASVASPTRAKGTDFDYALLTHTVKTPGDHVLRQSSERGGEVTRYKIVVH